MSLEQQLVDEEEGPQIPHVYKDSRGFWTISRGCLVDPAVPGAGLCQEAMDAQDAHSLAIAQARAALLAGFAACSDVRQAVLVSMCYQLGGLVGWPDFKAALAAGDYAEVSQQMLFANVAAGKPSAWLTETPMRCRRAAYMMRSNTWLAHGAPIP
jgi:GH24 family phage-related lysozyme (muramidase)